MNILLRSRTLVLGLCVALAAWTPARAAATTPVQYAKQGPLWNDGKRTLFYSIDQGSELIPLAWLQALKQADGKPFLDGSMARYGFLPTSAPSLTANLPVGFSQMPSKEGAMVGLGCAACHTRELTVGPQTYRIDGGPSFHDFTTFATDLDAAVGRVHADPTVFAGFASAVLGAHADDTSAIELLRADFELWRARFHTFIARSLPNERKWGPARMDAITLIYNRLAGLDLGPPPTYLIPANIEVGHAPVRYPFLWNASRQAITQWTGFAANSNDFYRLTRNLGEEYGVFGTFHPQKPTATFSFLDRNYTAVNSANFTGLRMAENLTKDMGPPDWPWPVDRGLAERGKTVFFRPVAQGGCAGCHGVDNADPAPGTSSILKTPVVDVGTDREAWHVVMRRIETGSMQGAEIEGLVGPLGARDTAIGLLRAAVVGAIVDDEKAEPQVAAERAKTDNAKKRIGAMAFDTLGLSAIKLEAAVKRKLGYGPPPPPPLVVNGYEARVLQGIWAVAPYLHNGSVPSLTELLKPPAERVKSFAVGPEYDPATIGLATNQTRFRYTLRTTGCEDLYSGDSNCGHDYGTRLPDAEKKALLEYLKTL